MVAEGFARNNVNITLTYLSSTTRSHVLMRELRG
jgi:hypothetical protein